MLEGLYIGFRVGHLLWCLFFIEAALQFQLSAIHSPGGDNLLADDLSRDRLSLFRAMVPQADAKPTLIPEELPQLLFHEELDWMSPTWIKWFASTFIRDWPSQPTGPMQQE